MARPGEKTILTIMLFVFCFSNEQNAYGYLDPGTGSFVIQILLAGMLGLLFTLRGVWNRAVLFVKRLFSRKAKNDGA